MRFYERQGETHGRRWEQESRKFHAANVILSPAQFLKIILFHFFIPPTKHHRPPFLPNVFIESVKVNFTESYYFASRGYSPFFISFSFFLFRVLRATLYNRYVPRRAYPVPTPLYEKCISIHHIFIIVAIRSLLFCLHNPIQKYITKTQFTSFFQHVNESIQEPRAARSFD